MRRKSSRATTLICNIDVTAFAAVMFALVAMFLLPASIVDHPRSLSVDMAKVSHAHALEEALREDALIVAVQRDGSIWLNQDRVLPDHLPAAIRQRVSEGAQARIYIRADARAKYGTVLEVLAGVRSAGIEDVAFLVAERNSGSRP